MKLPVISAAASAVFMSAVPSAHALSPECGQSLAVVRAVGKCSPTAFALHQQVEREHARVLRKFEGDVDTIRAMQRSHVGWKQYLESQCVAEHLIPTSELKLAIASPSQQRREGIECALELMRARLEELRKL